jgi:hypothetical protein
MMSSEVHHCQTRLRQNKNRKKCEEKIGGFTIEGGSKKEDSEIQ